MQYFRSLVFEFWSGKAIFSILSFRFLSGNTRFSVLSFWILEWKSNIFGP